MLKPSQGPSRSGAQAIFGTRAGATIGMEGVATTTGADMDPTPIPGISADPVVLAITAVLAIMVDLVGQMGMALTADRHQLTELI